MSLRVSPSPRAAEPKIETCAGGDLPLSDLGAQPAFELDADVCEQLQRGCCEMVSIEGVEVGVPRLLRSHDALLGQTPQSGVHRRLGASPNESGDVAAGQRPSRAAKDEHDLHVEPRANRCPRAREIHSDKYATRLRRTLLKRGCDLTCD